jgi:hypothetical protein
LAALKKDMAAVLFDLNLNAPTVKRLGSLLPDDYHVAVEMDTAVRCHRAPYSTSALVLWMRKRGENQRGAVSGLMDLSIYCLQSFPIDDLPHFSLGFELAASSSGANHGSPRLGL